MRVSAIVAMSQNRVIGNKNQLPWKLSEDLKHFRQVTTGHPVIMGRKTFESIGRLLPNRENIILSRQADYRVDGAQVFQSVEQALIYCQDPIGDGDSKKDPQEVFIIGGAEIYRQAMPHVGRLHLTLIHKDFEGDAFFPAYSPEQFEEVSREDHEGEISFSFLILDRK